MTTEDLKKIFLGSTLFRLDTILASRLVPILYVTGLAALLLWAVTHLFATFGRNFGDGLWGLLEIVVFGLLGLTVLRVACEALLVYFKAHESAARAVTLSRVPSPLIDEVRDAISDIAEEEDIEVRRSGRTTAVDTVPKLGTTRPKVKRTARRTARPKPAPPEGGA